MQRLWSSSAYILYPPKMAYRLNSQPPAVAAQPETARKRLHHTISLDITSIVLIRFTDQDSEDTFIIVLASMLARAHCEGTHK